MESSQVDAEMAYSDFTDETEKPYKDQEALVLVWSELRYLKFCLETEVETRTKSLDVLEQEVKSCQHAPLSNNELKDLHVVRDSVSCIATVLEDFRKDSLRKATESEKSIRNCLANVEKEVKRHAMQLETLENELNEVRLTSIDEDLRQFISRSNAQLESFSALSAQLEALKSASFGHEHLLKQLGKSATAEASFAKEQVGTFLPEPKKVQVKAYSELACSLNSSPKKHLRRCESIPMTVNTGLSPTLHHGNVSPRMLGPAVGPHVASSVARFVLFNGPSRSEKPLHRSSSCPTTPRRVGVLPSPPQAEKLPPRIATTYAFPQGGNALGRCRSPSPALQPLAASNYSHHCGKLTNLTMPPVKVGEFAFGEHYAGPPINDQPLLGPPVTSEVSL